PSGTTQVRTVRLYRVVGPSDRTESQGYETKLRTTSDHFGPNEVETPRRSVSRTRSAFSTAPFFRGCCIGFRFVDSATARKRAQITLLARISDASMSTRVCCEGRENRVL